VYTFWNSHVDKSGSSLDCAIEMIDGTGCEFPVGNVGSGRINMKVSQYAVTTLYNRPYESTIPLPRPTEGHDSPGTYADDFRNLAVLKSVSTQSKSTGFGLSKFFTAFSRSWP
jgi:hypothetical protein